MTSSNTVRRSIQKELDFLEKEKGPRLAKEFQEAVLEGDGLHDNALYRIKRDEIEINMNRVQELKRTLRESANEPAKTSDTVVVGSKVKLLDRTKNQEIEIKLITSGQVAFVSEAASVDSPIGKAILGKKKGKKVKVNLPNGRIKEYEILNIGH